MPRLPEDPKAPKDHIGRVVMNKKEYEKIMKLAQKKGISFSRLVRDAIALYIMEDKKQIKIGFPDTF
jgi:uncharacterized protein (DUF111 family)